MTSPTGPSVLRQEIEFMKACRRGHTPQTELLQQLSEKVHEIVVAMRERREGVVAELTALATEFAAQDPSQAVRPLLEDLSVSYQRLRDMESQVTEAYEAKEAQRQTMQAAEEALLSQVKQLSAKLTKTPARHSIEPIVEGVGQRVCDYQINPDSIRIRNAPTRFPTH